MQVSPMVSSVSSIGMEQYMKVSSMEEQGMGLVGMLIALHCKLAGGKMESSRVIAGASIGIMKIQIMLISCMAGLRTDNVWAHSENIQMSNTGIGNAMIHSLWTHRTNSQVLSNISTL